MVDNTDNSFKAAPDKGSQNGMVWRYSGSFEQYMANLKANPPNKTVTAGNLTIQRRDPGYWLPDLSAKGIQPVAGAGYKFYRNVKDYGAVGDGSHDDTEAINAAIKDGNRCGLECGNTFAQGALIYFPSGTYKVSRPIIQLYYTQFIGNANDRPTILGTSDFVGIALMDTDVYIPEGRGSEWYINQNQFFRHIRNFIFDLRQMPKNIIENKQHLVPTGIHWQVAQATSLQNLKFVMPTGAGVTHHGIFTENGSGGFVSGS